MAVRKLKNGKWIADVTIGLKWDGTPDRRSRQCETKSKAQKAEREFLLLKAQAKGKISGSLTFNEFLDLIYWPQKPNMRSNTRRGYERDIKLRLSPAFGNVPISDINRAGIQRMISNCETRKVATNARDTLSSILSVALEMGFINVNPARFTYQFPPKGIQQFDHMGVWLTKFSEHKKVLDYVRDKYSGESEEKICVLGLCFGLRTGEIFGLNVSDIDLNNKTISINRTYTIGKGGPSLTDPKTERSYRTIPMTDYAYHRIIEWDLSHESVVFGKDGKRVNPHTANKRIANMVRKSDGMIPHITMFSMRHSFATSCINAGMEIANVSALLGHCDVSTTYNRYVKPTLATLQTDTSIIDNAFLKD